MVGAIDVASDPASLSDGQTAEQLIAIRAEIDRLEARFAQLAWSGHQRGIGTVDGAASTQAWLRHHTGMREGDARAAIESGATAELLPSIGEAWRDGHVTTGAVRTIAAARVDGHDLKLVALEPVLLDLARAQDLRELRRACTHFRNCARADGTEPREHDGVTISAGYDGRTIINGDLSSSAAEIVVTALHELTDPPTDGDHRTAARRRADALVKMAELAMGSIRTAGPDGPVRAKPAATIVIDWTTLTGERFGRLDGAYTGTLHRTDVFTVPPPTSSVAERTVNALGRHFHAAAHGRVRDERVGGLQRGGRTPASRRRRCFSARTAVTCARRTITNKQASTTIAARASSTYSSP